MAYYTFFDKAYFSAADKDWMLVQKLCEFCLQSTYMFPMSMSGWKLSSEWLRIGGWWTYDENVALQTDDDEHFSVHEWIYDPVVLMKLIIGLTLSLRVGDAWISLPVQQVVEFWTREDCTVTCTEVVLEVSLWLADLEHCNSSSLQAKNAL